jgi:hypothetical protein
MIETPHIKLWIEDGILYSRYANNCTMDIEIAKDCVEKRLTLSQGISYPALVDMRGLQSVTKEAREYMAREGAALITAAALITGSELNRMLGNIFLRINRPKVPLKLFTNEKEAKDWLKQFL